MKKRIPISVEVVFDDKGGLIPKKLFYKGKTYEIDKLVGVRAYCPVGIACVSPTEYITIIDGFKRKIYFEQNTNKWFSVKEYKLCN